VSFGTKPCERTPPLLLRVAITVECLLSGLLGLYVGLDYIPRIAFLKRWFDGFEVFHALLAQARPTDLLQDYGGARALLFGGDAYEPTGSLAHRYATMSYTSLSYVSTHPPTAFLLLVPIAGLPLGAASAIWAALIIGGLIVAVRIAGAPWFVSVALGPMLVLLPPVGGGVNQLALAVLALTFFAYGFRRWPAAAGVLIGIASLTKFVPALLLMPFVLRRQWSAAVALAMVWLIGLTLVIMLNSGAIQAYLRSEGADTAMWIAEPGNGAFVIMSMRYGVAGVCLAALLIGCILWREIRDQSGDIRMSWARWNWVATAVLPIAWSFSVLPLALSVVVLFHRRDLVAMLVALAGFGPLVFTQSAVSPIPAFVCIAGVGVGLALAGTGLSARLSRLSVVRRMALEGTN
jgi:hypothetical protein